MESNINPALSEQEKDGNNAELVFLRKQLMLLNERLKRSEKHKSSFLSNMRNEIINPFSSILSLSANLLKGGLKDDAKVQKMLSLIYQETFGLDFHLKTIFLAAEIESGECYPCPALMRPEAAIAETLVALDHLFQKKGIRLVVYQSFEEDVWCDPEKLQMILLGVLYHIFMDCKAGDGISVKVFTKEENLYAEIYVPCIMGNQWSLFDHAHFEELCLFNQDIEGIHLSVARSLTESLNGRMEAGFYNDVIAGFRFSIPVEKQGDGMDFFEDRGLIFQ